MIAPNGPLYYFDELSKEQLCKLLEELFNPLGLAPYLYNNENTKGVDEFEIKSANQI